jgi:hypothetical protein
LRCKNEALLAKYQNRFTVRPTFKEDQTDGGPATRNDSVLSLLRDEFLPNFEKFLSVSARDDDGHVIGCNFNAGHDFGNAQLHEGGGKAPIADLKTASTSLWCSRDAEGGARADHSTRDILV